MASDPTTEYGASGGRPWPLFHWFRECLPSFCGKLPQGRAGGELGAEGPASLHQLLSSQGGGLEVSSSRLQLPFGAPKRAPCWDLRAAVEAGEDSESSSSRLLPTGV